MMGSARGEKWTARRARWAMGMETGVQSLWKAPPGHTFPMFRAFVMTDRQTDSLLPAHLPHRKDKHLPNSTYRASPLPEYFSSHRCISS